MNKRYILKRMCNYSRKDCHFSTSFSFTIKVTIITNNNNFFFLLTTESADWEKIKNDFNRNHGDVVFGLGWNRVWHPWCRGWLDIKVCHGRESDWKEHKFWEWVVELQTQTHTTISSCTFDGCVSKLLPLMHPASLLIGRQKQSIMHSPTQSYIKQVKGNWWHPRP